MSIQGFKYYVLFVDDYSRYSWIFPMKNKSEVYSIFVHFHKQVENLLSTKIKMLQTDEGGEYTSLALRQYLANHGICQRFSCPKHPEQNGLAERKHRHIVDTGLTLLAHAHVPSTYWVEAFNSAIYIINRLPSPVIQYSTPYTKLFHREPQYKFLRVFGCACFPYLRPYNTSKLQVRSKKCVFLGYSLNHLGYRCLDLSTGRVYLSRHVVFDEGCFPFRETNSPSPGNSSILHPLEFFPLTFPPVSSHPYPLINDTNPPTPPSSSQDNSRSLSLSIPPQFQPNPSTSQQPSSALTFSTINSPILLSPSQPTSPPPINPSSSIPYLPSRPQPNPVPIQPSASTVPSSHSMITRGKDGIRKPNPKYALHASLLNDVVEPTGFKQAVKHAHWRQAMFEEYAALQKSGTWDLVSYKPSMNVLPNKWIFKIKKRADGSIERYKARLVANGFHQQEGIDFSETFSSVVKHSTIRLVLALAVSHSWHVRQLDVHNAFLHGYITEDVYMRQPSGFVDPTYPNHVCKLKRSLYGLKQAPRAWFQCFADYIEDLGFKESRADYSMFTYRHDGVFLILLIYVDDILLTGNNPSSINKLIHRLSSLFSMKDLGPIHYFLGIEATYHGSHLSLTQTKYVVDLLKHTNMHEVQPISSPATSGQKLSKHAGTCLSDPSEYRSVVGALQYLTLTRPDISYSVNQACKFMQAPTTTHWTAVKRILRYLKATITHGLLYKPGSLHLQAYSDADYAGDPDNRHSSGGYCVYLGPNLISWSSKTHKTVSRSSAEAEYRQLAYTAAEISWLRSIFCDLGLFLHCPRIWCDNISAIAIASNPVFHGRTKHVEVDYHYVRDKVVNRELQVSFVSTTDQLADIFTKGLPAPRFHFLVSKLPVLSRPASLRGHDRPKECLHSSRMHACKATLSLKSPNLIPPSL
ncbi:hypothetical protein ABKV19_009748 [Rosa sericea]